MSQVFQIELFGRWDLAEEDTEPAVSSLSSLDVTGDPFGPDSMESMIVSARHLADVAGDLRKTLEESHEMAMSSSRELSSIPAR